MRAEEFITEKWSKKYKRSIDCANPKGFSQRAHCAGRKKNEDITEGVNDNYLYHATQPGGLMRILKTGIIKASYRPQAATQAITQHPTISTTRSKQYAESNEFVDFLNLTREGNSVILVFDRNAVANHYKMFSTSQGTQTVGDEFEEVIVVPKGSMPVKGTLKGFYFNPARQEELKEFENIPWFKELLNSPYYLGPKQAMQENFTEAFNKPYKGKWEKSESGSYDMLAKLPDGTNLSIMFNNEGGGEWQVEFYRNNSQEVTGEGDAQRIFATVLGAIEKFIKKHNPLQITFSASKEVEPGQNSESRAKLYNRLVDRYAAAWGYDARTFEHGNAVSYELSKYSDSPLDSPFESAVAENFADGKNPGRKGLAKRSGVNCKASVTTLRNVAKHSTGEKQRMAHWCANMKSGKNKSKGN